MTCPTISTQMSQKNPDYGIWCQEQVLTLISRVRFLTDVHIVGDARDDPATILQDTINAVVSVLNINCPTACPILDLLNKVDVLRSNSPAAVVPLTARVLQLFNVDVPPPIGFCYLLISWIKKEKGYLGTTIDFNRRLREHNSPKGGSTQTHLQHLKPWVPALLVVGFGGTPDDDFNRLGRLAFETAWRGRNYEQNIFTSVQMMQNGVALVDEWKLRHDPVTQKLLFPDLKALPNLHLQHLCESFFFHSFIWPQAL